MPDGDALTRWTVRVALALYLLALVFRLCASHERTARLLWTGGCLAFLIHMMCAFHFFHHWSHADAYEVTARQTAEVTGMDWGGGLYFNYVFALVWVGDACWWWYNARSYSTRPRAAEWTIQSFLGFMAFNATVIFGRGAIQWAGWFACVILAVTSAYALYRRGSFLRG